jgi:RNA polymerase sigma factor (sigma-70 family)
MIYSSDGYLVVRTRRGEIEAYSTLVQRHQSLVFNVCYRLLGERTEAEDLTQDTFIRAYHRLGSFDETRSFAPWIRRVATNLCLNHLRRTQSKIDKESCTPIGIFSIQHGGGGNHFSLSPKDRVPLTFPFSFGGSKLYTFGSLLNSSTLFPFNIKRYGLISLISWLQSEKIAFFQATPTTLRQLGLILTEENVFPAMRIY